MNTKKHRSEIFKEMVRIGRGLKEDADVELRGLHWEIGRNRLEGYVIERYRRSPAAFHRDDDSFVAARLIKEVLEDISTDLRLIKRLPISGAGLFLVEI